MELFQKKIGPIFLKENSDAATFIEKMNELQNKATTPELKKEIEKQIKLASYGSEQMSYRHLVLFEHRGQDA